MRKTRRRTAAILLTLPLLGSPLNPAGEQNAAFLTRRRVAVRLPARLRALSAVDSVSVCTGDLCTCQDAGGGPAILADLASRDLPYAVRDTGCVGACGPGAVVSVKYADGSRKVCRGPEETLQGLGLAAAADTVGDARAAAFASAFAADEGRERPGDVCAGPWGEGIPSQSQHPAPQVETNLDSTRERMRAELAEGEQAPNPWAMATSYLLKKATEKLSK